LVGVDKSNVMMDSFIYSMIMINHRERKEAKLGDCVLIQIKRGIQNILNSCLSKHFQYQYLYQYQYAQHRLPTKKKGNDMQSILTHTGRCKSDIGIIRSCYIVMAIECITSINCYHLVQQHQL
jgi:hypothetical protein